MKTCLPLLQTTDSVKTFSTGWPQMTACRCPARSSRFSSIEPLKFAKKNLEGMDGVDVALFEGITPGAVDYSAIVQKIKRFREFVVFL